MKIYELDESLRTKNPCWKGYHPVGTKKKAGKTVPNCVPESEQGVAEDTDIDARISNLKDAIRFETPRSVPGEDHREQYARHAEKIAGYKAELKKLVAQKKQQGVAEGLSLDEQFDIIEEMVEALSEQHGVDSEMIWEDFESVDDNELYETAAWRRKEGKNKKGGLNAKGVASYRRENPGSKLQTAVTTKPSKLKPGSKAAKRRKSFCARMGGVKGPMKKPNGKPTRKALALRKWNC